MGFSLPVGLWMSIGLLNTAMAADCREPPAPCAMSGARCNLAYRVLHAPVGAVADALRSAGRGSDAGAAPSRWREWVTVTGEEGAGTRSGMRVLRVAPRAAWLRSLLPGQGEGKVTFSLSPREGGADCGFRGHWRVEGKAGWAAGELWLLPRAGNTLARLELRERSFSAMAGWSLDALLRWQSWWAPSEAEAQARAGRERARPGPSSP